MQHTVGLMIVTVVTTMIIVKFYILFGIQAFLIPFISVMSAQTHFHTETCFNNTASHQFFSRLFYCHLSDCVCQGVTESDPVVSFVVTESDSVL